MTIYPIKNNELEKKYMIGALLTVLVVIGVFKLTGWTIKVCGKILGIVLGLAGAVIVGMLGITIIGLAVFMLPVIVIAGIIGIGCACVKVLA